jgi:uncharacterized membrane protein YoaK (UPF0700 family)
MKHLSAAIIFAAGAGCSTCLILHKATGDAAILGLVTLMCTAMVAVLRD